jgi:hypothetical protein
MHNRGESLKILPAQRRDSVGSGAASGRKILPPIDDDEFLKSGFETLADIKETKYLLTTSVA